jgi:hypothetical protein
VVGVVTGRLPRIGDAPETDPAAVTDPALLDLTGRYARAFNNPQGKPVFAIVLIDRGDPGLDRAALAALPLPVTFVLDPTLPDVAGLANGCIAAGQEVAMLATAIPAGQRRQIRKSPSGPMRLRCRRPPPWRWPRRRRRR